MYFKFSFLLDNVFRSRSARKWAVLIIGAIVAFLFLVSNSKAVSYSKPAWCDNAKTNTEIMICGDSNLSTLDKVMVELFDRVKGSTRAEAGQRDWRNLVRNQCKDVACLTSAYQQRIRELKEGRDADLSASPLLSFAIPQSEPGARVSYAGYNDRTVSWLRASKVLEQAYTLTSSVVGVRQSLRVVAKPCGQNSAFYIDQQDVVVICYELVENLWDFVRQEAVQEGITMEQAEARVRGALLFVVLHELGHATLHHERYDSSLGPREPAADNFASTLLLRSTATSVEQLRSVMWGVRTLLAAFTAWGLDSSDTSYSDEHNSSLQRYSNFGCLLGGKYPELIPALLEQKILSPQRAQGCRDTWIRANNAIRDLASRSILNSTAAK